MLKLKDSKAAPSKDKKPAAPPLPLGKRVWEFFKSIFVALAAVIVLNSFVVQSFQVPTGSMENTVMAGELLFVNKFLYGGSSPQAVPLLGLLAGKEVEIPWFRVPGFRDPERGDVIVFIFPGYRDDAKAREFQYYLKRCVAVSHDTIQVVDKRLLINGKPFDNPIGVHYTQGVLPKEFVDGDIFPVGKPWNRDNYGPIVVPGEGDVIQLTPENIGEWNTFIRREGHEVSVSGGMITIDGKPATSYTVERDYVFGMGDNRDDSLDSRFWGFIPKEHVIGTPMIVYMSWSPDIPLFNLFKKLGSIRFGRIGKIIG
ncbi:MAG: signal peptidase I [Ignavibacteriae bacterium]|nr:signal peptidase I [Ignavibacteriota bacterium]